MTRNIRILNRTSGTSPDRADAYQLFFEQNPAGMYLASLPDGTIENCNEAFATLLGFQSPLELLGRKLWEFFVEEGAFEEFRTNLTAQGQLRGDQKCMRCNDGSTIWILQDVQPVGTTENEINVLATVVNITAQKQKEETFLKSALYDSLTGLPNRSLFLDRLSLCFERASRTADYTFAVLFLDLDRFKWVNDSFGHRIGDELLVAAAKRLNSKIRGGDIVARLGGDEFGVLLGEVKDTADARRVASRIQAAFQNPFRLGERELYITASMGIALSSGQWFANQDGAMEVTPVSQPARTSAERPEDLLWEADAVLYRAKQMGRARYEIFDAAMHEKTVSLAQFSEELRKGVKENQFVTFYEPVVSLQSGKIIGFEACLKWKHPRRGILDRSEFHFLAEQIGLYGTLDRIILQSVCEYLKHLQNTFEKDHEIFVCTNIAVPTLRDPIFVPHVREVLQKFGIAAERLWFEVQESSLIEQFEHIRHSLDSVRSLGIAVTLDDFGKGFSSLKGLPQFPIDMVKVDSSLIAGMSMDEMYVDVVGTLIALGHSLGFSIFAEGVQTEKEAGELKRLGCDGAQGKYFSDPIDPASATRLIGENRTF